MRLAAADLNRGRISNPSPTLQCRKCPDERTSAESRCTAPSEKSVVGLGAPLFLGFSTNDRKSTPRSASVAAAWCCLFWTETQARCRCSRGRISNPSPVFRFGFLGDRFINPSPFQSTHPTLSPRQYDDFGAFRHSSPIRIPQPWLLRK